MLLLEFPFPQLAPELDPSMLWTEPVGYQQGYDNMTCRMVVVMYSFSLIESRGRVVVIHRVLGIFPFGAVHV
ncbi:Uncharacterized protein APZ42_032980 [Daphnia magna]|uniref:Uncharacterized protein n=1 Tax=Daphnia magna TaxID=35525 RepID=A0A164LIA3_9CRUS|nr:Uncharacterized protein APZ42_032980 [Daphnia magna]